MSRTRPSRRTSTSCRPRSATARVCSGRSPSPKAPNSYRHDREQALTGLPKEAAMNQLSEILGDKGGEVLKIEAEASVFEAVQKMVEANVGSLLVTDHDEIVGIVTERDYL